MSLIIRVRALLLFFIDYWVLIYCFTILTYTVFFSLLVEYAIFQEGTLDLRLLCRFFIPILIFILILFVSYRIFLGVYFFSTILKILLISPLLVLPIFCFKFFKLSNGVQNVQGFTGKNVVIKAEVVSQEKSGTYLVNSRIPGFESSLIKVEGFSVLQLGKRCVMKGRVVQPKSFEDFDYRRYLFRKGIYSIIEVESYECEGVGNIFVYIRGKLEDLVERAVPEPEASLLIGIMFGSKRVFKKDFNDALSIVGVSHVIAASGYNVTLVSQFVEAIFKKKGSKRASLIKISSIWMFTIFSGCSSSLIRASTMNSIGLFGALFGREVNIGGSLLICVTVLSVINPFILYDVGFLFSFTSVIGLTFFVKCFDSIKSKFFKDSFIPTITSILFTLPISIYFFGKISLIAVLANVIILPIIASTIFWGLGATIINIFVRIDILYTVSYLQLNIFKNFVSVLSKVDMLEMKSDGNVLLLYIFLFLFCLLKYPVSSNNYYILQAKKYE